MNQNDLTPFFRYNYVVFFAISDYWKAILGKELYESPYVHVYERTFRGSKLLQFLFRIHWSYKINSIVDIPLKWIWFKKMYNQAFENDLPICFIYMDGIYLYRDGGFTDYVRKKDPRNRQVIVHQDLITKKCKFDYSIIRSKVDMATTYDQGEAKKYKIHYFREDTYSKLIPLPSTVDFIYDVFFLGAAKDRLDEILDTYKYLTRNGIKCKFIITGVDEEKKYYSEGIEYSSGISYIDNLQYIIKSKCILEIIQKGSVDITTRALEAIAYQRKLLTNCKVIPDGYFNKGQLQVFESPSSIQIDFIEELYNQNIFKPIFDLNPMRRLLFIQNELESVK